MESDEEEDEGKTTYFRVGPGSCKAGIGGRDGQKSREVVEIDDKEDENSEVQAEQPRPPADHGGVVDLTLLDDEEERSPLKSTSGNGSRVKGCGDGQGIQSMLLSTKPSAPGHTAATAHSSKKRKHGEDRRASLTACYNEKLTSRLLPCLHKSISLAKRSYPPPSPSQKPGPALPPPHGVSSPLTEQQVAARTNLENLMIEYGTLLSEAEWGGVMESRRVLFIQGFPVNEEDGGHVQPLLDSTGGALAKSMRVGEAMRLSLGVPSDRIDMCQIAGHHARWSNGSKPTDADKSCMRKVMRLALRCGYNVVVVMGGEGTIIARESCREEPWDCRLRGSELGWGKAERVIEVRPRSGGSSAVPNPSTMVVTSYHPQGCLPQGKAGVRAALDTANIFDQQVQAIRSFLGLPPLEHIAPLQAYVTLLAEGLEDNDKLDGGLHALRLRRDLEIGKDPVPLEELPGWVRAQLLEDWGVETDEQWDRIVSSGEWRPRDANCPTPWSPLCYALSDSGVKGGKETMANRAKRGSEAGLGHGTAHQLLVVGVKKGDEHLHTTEELQQKYRDEQSSRGAGASGVGSGKGRQDGPGNQIGIHGDARNIRSSEDRMATLRFEARDVKVDGVGVFTFRGPAFFKSSTLYVRVSKSEYKAVTGRELEARQWEKAVQEIKVRVRGQAVSMGPQELHDKLDWTSSGPVLEGGESM